MTITASLILLILALIWLVMAVAKGEFRGSGFWWSAFIVVAVLCWFGLPTIR